MKKLSRGAWIAVAAVATIPATLAIAEAVDGGRWQTSPETRSRLEEGRLAMAKAALQLNADQEKLWAPVEEQIRDAFKAREARRAEWDKKREERKAEKTDGGDATQAKRPDLAERFEKISTRLSERADRMKAFSAAFKPFYASLTDQQKDVLRPLVHELAPGFGRGGHDGPRWGFGGWGPGGGPDRHHGWFHGDRGDPDGQGGPGMQDDGHDQDGGPAQAEPEKKG
jgi:hypothetical protein